MTNATMERLKRRQSNMPGPKRGDDLFEGTTYPRTWDDYVGQDEAKSFLRAAATSARIRGTRLDHILIATGAHGIGKSALARLIANEMDAGLVEVQGVVDVTDAMRIFASMSDGDILFWDEIHNAIAGGKSKVEWLLPLLQDGVVVTSKGVLTVPDITIIAASTDAQKLPETILSRFTVKPVLESYTAKQADQLVQVISRAVFKDLNLPQLNDFARSAVADAGNNNPREITQLLKILRDSVLAGEANAHSNGSYDFRAMYRWSGITCDGLDRLAQRYLIELFLTEGFIAGEKTIAQALGEPTPPKHTEKLLIQKGYIRIVPKGRELTAEGIDRATELAEEIQENTNA